MSDTGESVFTILRRVGNASGTILHLDLFDVVLNEIGHLFVDICTGGDELGGKFHVFYMTVGKKHSITVVDEGVDLKGSGSFRCDHASAQQFHAVGHRFAVFGIQSHGDAEKGFILVVRPEPPESHFVDHGGNQSPMDSPRVALVVLLVTEQCDHTAVLHIIEGRLQAVGVVQSADGTHAAVALFAENFHSLSDDVDKFHFKDQHGAGRNGISGAAFAVGEFRGDHELIFAAHVHKLESLHPSGDHLSDAENSRLSALHGAVKDLAVNEFSGVVHFDLIGGKRFFAASFFKHLVLQSAGSDLNPLFGLVGFEELFAGFHICLGSIGGGGTGCFLDLLLEGLHELVVFVKFKGRGFAGAHVRDGGEDLFEIQFDGEFGNVSGNVHAESIAHFFHISHFFFSFF